MIQKIKDFVLKHRTKFIWALILVVGFALGKGWGNNGVGYYDTGNMEMDMVAMDESMPAPSMMVRKSVKMGGNAVVDVAEAQATDRKIVRTGNYQVETEEVEKKVEELKNYVEQNAGFVDNVHVYEWNENQKRADLIVRVPAEKFEESGSFIKDLGVLRDENVSSVDITEQWQDNEARIANLKVEEEAIQKLMNRAGELSDVLEVSKELNRIRRDIEDMERIQLRNKARVEYSTLNVHIYPEVTIIDLQDQDWSISKAWKLAVNSMKGSLRTVAEWGLIAVAYAVIWLPLLLIYLGWRWWRRRNIM